MLTELIEEAMAFTKNTSQQYGDALIKFWLKTSVGDYSMEIFYDNGWQIDINDEENGCRSVAQLSNDKFNIYPLILEGSENMFAIETI